MSLKNDTSITSSHIDITKTWDSNITTVIDCLNGFCEFTDFSDEYDMCRSIIEWINSCGLNNIDDICNLMSNDMFSNLMSFLDDFRAYSNGLVIKCNIFQNRSKAFRKNNDFKI